MIGDIKHRDIKVLGIFVITFCKQQQTRGCWSLGAQCAQLKYFQTNKEHAKQ